MCAHGGLVAGTYANGGLRKFLTTRGQKLGVCFGLLPEEDAVLLSDVSFVGDGVKRATVDGKEWTVVVP